VDVRIPNALSFLAYNTFTGEVRGIHQLQEEYEELYGPGNYVPSVMIAYWSFRIMVGAGFLMAFLVLVAFFIWGKKKFKIQSKWWYLLTAAIALPYLANTTGWLLTETGRQPWVVYGLLKTADAVSPNVPKEFVMASLAVFTLLYGALMVVDVYLMVKFARAGVEDEPSAAQVKAS
jgi:cytochrome d ubiquinol oxidase subunit I